MIRKILYNIGCAGFVLGFMWMLVICGGMDSENLKISTAVYMVLSDIFILALSNWLMNKYKDKSMEEVESRWQ